MGQQITGPCGFKVDWGYQAEYSTKKEVIINSFSEIVFRSCVGFGDLHCLQYKERDPKRLTFCIQVQVT